MAGCVYSIDVRSFLKLKFTIDHFGSTVQVENMKLLIVIVIWFAAFNIMLV